MAVEPAVQPRWLCRFIMSGLGAMFMFMCAMIQIVPTITRKTMRTPNARARTLLALSGPLLEPLGPDLRNHGAQPEQAGGNVQAVTADQGEECGQEGAALRAGALGDHSSELVKLDRQEDEAEQAGQQQPELRPGHIGPL